MLRALRLGALALGFPLVIAIVLGSAFVGFRLVQAKWFGSIPQPERMEQLVLQEGAHNPKKREYLRLKDIEAATSKWVTSLQSEEKPTKMIVIKQWENYNKTFEMFDRMASDGYISTLPDVEKRTLLNFLIQQISVYQQPNYQASK